MITPTTYTCETILNDPQPNYRLRFKRGDSYYVITPPPGGLGPIIEAQYTGLGLDTFQLSELAGASNGVYTWLLYDINNETNIVVKRTLSVSEIGTKHLDILKDICRNKHLSTDTNPESINVYCAGELKMTKTETVPGVFHIKYTINVLSGSYSNDVINPKDISDEFEYWLSNLFVAKSELNDNVHLEVLIDKSFKTLINNKEMDSRDNFNNYIENLLRNVRGLEVYKFDAHTHKDLFERSDPRYSNTWDAKKQYIRNMYAYLIRNAERSLPHNQELLAIALEDLVEKEEAELDELNQQFPIINMDGMGEYKLVLNDPPLSYGGKSFKKKGRKSKKHRKSKKQRKSKRRRKSKIQKH
jgi:hypothetical protein